MQTIVLNGYLDYYFYFLSLAKKYNIQVLDASTWNISMGFDGVHFSIEGHKQFAKCLIDSIKK